MSNFSPSGAEARAAGYRACLRCRPDEVGRDREAVAKAVRLIEASRGAAAAGRRWRRRWAMPRIISSACSAATWASRPRLMRGRVRARRAETHLEEDKSVTEAIYDAGYAAPSRFYADAKERLGMTPSAWRDGGRGETIRYVIADSALGPLLIAATAKGICRLTFGEDEAALHRRFPNADIRPDDGVIAPWVEAALAQIDRPSDHQLAARRARHGVPGKGVGRTAQDPARRNAQLCPDRRRGRPARRGPRGRHRQWLEPGLGARALPPRDPLRRQPWRLRRRACPTRSSCWRPNWDRVRATCSAASAPGSPPLSSSACAPRSSVASAAAESAASMRKMTPRTISASPRPCGS